MLMAGEMSDERPRELTRKEKFDVWMVNEGYRRLYVVHGHDLPIAANNASFVFVFVILHVMVFTFGMLNYGLKVRNGLLRLDLSLLTYRRITQSKRGTNSA